MVLEVLAMAIREEKEIKWIYIGNYKVKLSLFADEMILYRENPKKATKILLEIINEFSKVAGYQINTQESLSLSYTLTKKYKEEKIALMNIFSSLLHLSLWNL